MDREAGPRHDRHFLHQELDDFLDMVEKDFDEETDLATRAGRARMFFANLMGLTACIAGEGMLAAVYGDDPPSSDRRASLRRLGSRLYFAKEVFRAFEWDRVPSSLSAAFDEIRAIAGGDEPHLFASFPRPNGQSKHGFKLARLKLAAFEWEAYLEKANIPLATRQAAITEAFGRPWDTIRKWRSEIEKTLGQDNVESHLNFAILQAYLGRPLRTGFDNNEDAIAKDGRAFITGIRPPLEVVGKD
jgi:hypothetical protein